jgi:hypothetical protein
MAPAVRLLAVPLLLLIAAIGLCTGAGHDGENGRVDLS